MNGIITRRELAERMERICAERSCLHVQEHFVPADDFAPLLRAEQVWCWEAAGIPVADASVWLQDRLGELPRRKGHGGGFARLYIWISAAHSLEVPDRLIGELSCEVDHLLFDIFLREDLERTKLGLLLLASPEDICPPSSAG